MGGDEGVGGIRSRKIDASDLEPSGSGESRESSVSKNPVGFLHGLSPGGAPGREGGTAERRNTGGAENTRSQTSLHSVPTVCLLGTLLTYI